MNRWTVFWGILLAISIVLLMQKMLAIGAPLCTIASWGFLLSFGWTPKK